jgi:hypothetical protein
MNNKSVRNPSQKKRHFRMVMRKMLMEKLNGEERKNESNN